MTRIVGISGKPGSNKLFYAFRIMRELRARGHRTLWANFADPLYEEFNQIADLYLSGMAQEAIIDKFGLEGAPTSELFELLSQDLGTRSPEFGYNRRVEAVRRGLGVLSTKIRRKQDESYYINILDRRLKHELERPDFAVVTDLRFPNEADWIRLNGGLNLRIEQIDPSDSYGGYKYNEGLQDTTETALDDYPFFDYHFFREDFNGKDFGKELESFFCLSPFEERVR